MERIDSVDELGPLSRIAIIINCGTLWVSTLALVSVLRGGDIPVLLVNCGDVRKAAAHFAQVASAWDLRFHYIEMPLRKHGATLDALFRTLRVTEVLLVDSDLEIRDQRLLADMQQALDASPEAYGSGVLHGPAAMGHEHGFSTGVAHYSERMWIPLVLLRRDLVCRALAAGVSFRQQRHYGEGRGTAFLSRLLAIRWRLPVRRLLGLPEDPHSVPGQPSIVEFDTGASVHAYLKARGATFAVVPGVKAAAIHLHGATRRRRQAWKRAVLSLLGIRIEDNATVDVDPEQHARETLSAHGCRMP